MPFTVITLKKVPASLRGDLTKWMQEIDTGVYVGSLNTRIRENLWKRIEKQAGIGEATMSYSCRNEIGYNFLTMNTARHVVDYDGIPLVILPEAQTEGTHLKKGFSDASKQHSARLFSSNRKERTADTTVNKDNKTVDSGPVVVIDLETTGLHAENDSIIEIGAVKYENEHTSEFQRLIRLNRNIPEFIVKLTGITNEIAEQGDELEDVLKDFLVFIGTSVLKGYNIQFDIDFLNAGLARCDMPALANQSEDLLKTVRRRNIFQTDYKLETTLKVYEIAETVPHRALDDARLIFNLAKKLNKI